MLSKCCCCVPLRNGSLVLAIFGFVQGIVFLAMSNGAWIHIIDGIFYLLAYGFLLFGALKYNEKAVLVCLVCTGVAIVLGIIMAIIAIASIDTLAPELANNCAAILDELHRLNMTCDQFKSAAIGASAGIFIAGSLLNVYFWICNYSFYKELKEGGGEASV